MLFRRNCKQSSLCVRWSYHGATERCLLFNKFSPSSFAPGWSSGPKCCYEEFGTKYCSGSHQTTTPAPKLPSTTIQKPKNCECGRSSKVNSKAAGRIWKGRPDYPYADPWMIFLSSTYVLHTKTVKLIQKYIPGQLGKHPMLQTYIFFQNMFLDCLDGRLYHPW